jgi:hypothetical protein
MVVSLICCNKAPFDLSLCKATITDGRPAPIAVKLACSARSPPRA